MKFYKNPLKESMIFFATCPKGIEEILCREIISLGGTDAKLTRAGVSFRGVLQTAYQVCLWSRLVNRVLMPLARFRAKSPDDLYDGAFSLINWDDHMDVKDTLAVDFVGTGSNRMHSHFAALRVKDAVADQFSRRLGCRPSVNRQKPDIRINVYGTHDRATISLDLSGHSLHKRGYREGGGDAPLKENLAAAILIRSGWQEMAGKGTPLVDPMCGSGTLLIEAAMMALDMAPGLGRDYYGFLGWKGHDPLIWRSLFRDAKERAQKGAKVSNSQFFGFDSDNTAINQARINAARAGLSRYIRFKCRSIHDLEAPETSALGLVVVNPPYGERMGEIKALESLYQALGERLKAEFLGWRASIFTGNPDLGKHMGIRAKKYYNLFNGALPCRLLNFEITETSDTGNRAPSHPMSKPSEKPALGSGAQMFANRLKKNLRTVGKWAQKEGISCYRLYDADMPEYAVAIDMYHDWVHIQEYQAPTSVQPEDSRRRLKQIMSALPETLNVSPEKILLKVRKKTRGKDQYEKISASARFLEVKENGLRFWVNLKDYLDTGLFLDHRVVRQLIREYSDEKRMLNLFCYTGTATVYAAAGGAAQTTSVDLSRPYLSWAEKNLVLNGIRDSRHRLVQADCLDWIPGCRDQFDLIFLSPPTFSNSKRMEKAFDIQRDHVDLLNGALKLLAQDGLLIFSCSRRKFRIDRESLKGWDVDDISRKTIPRDFVRNQRIHHCFEIRRTEPAEGKKRWRKG